MKCRLHASDLSSANGVCASCLRERLFLLISAQSQTHQLQLHLSESDDRRNSVPPPPQLPFDFPRSVSPYVNRRKSDDVRLDFSDRRFHTMPPIIAPIGDCTETKIKEKRKKKNKFSFITNLFKSRSDKSESDRRTAESKSITAPKSVAQRNSIQNHRVSDRGMSPERSPYDREEEEEEESSSRSSESCEPTWKQTPVSSSSAAIPTTRRRHSNMSSLAFCLSPLVRASPKRNWKRKTDSMPAEGKDVGAVANSFCKNRSKKLAEFGRGGFDRRR